MQARNSSGEASMRLPIEVAASTVFLAAISYSTVATAALVVTGSSYSVLAGTTVQAEFTVTNSSPAAASDIEGMTFTAQIASGIATAPKIVSLDLLSGTIWNGHASSGSIFTPTGGNQLQYLSCDLLTDKPGDFVDANGLLATVTIDTTGAAVGDYAIKLVGTKTAGRDSEFLDGFGNVIAANFGVATVTISVPEPSGATSLLYGFCMITTAAAIRRLAAALNSSAV
jgi:hypothetical protein